MKAPHPQFINALKILQKRLASFVLEFKKIDHPKQQKHYLAFAKASVATLKIIQPIIKATKEVVPNCPPEDIPACIHKYDDAKGPQILNSRINIIKKHKEDYENYLLNCFGIQLGWKDGLPSPNVGGKFSFRRKNNRLIIYTKKMEKNSSLGQVQISIQLRRYRQLESTIRNTLVEENANSSLTEEIDLMRLIALKKLLTEAPGGLNDIYDNIIKTPELKQQYQKIIERIRKDWETDGRMTTLKEKIEKKLQQTMERAQDSPCPDEEPEPKKIHEAVLEQKDLSELPLFNQGVGDASAIDSNDIDQGATGDCYYLSSVAALARMQPELFHGKSAIIKKKGENYEVTLHLRKDRNSKKRTPTIITVRPSTWVNPEGKPIYQGLGDDELWAILLEKAYAQALGGYDNIEGGTTKEALEVLTGKVSSTYDPGTMSTDDLMEKIQTSIDCQYPTTFNSRGTGEKEVEISFGGKVQKLFQGHAYTLDKMEGDRIFLYNPHGKHHLELDSKLLKTHFSNLQILEL